MVRTYQGDSNADGDDAETVRPVTISVECCCEWERHMDTMDVESDMFVKSWAIDYISNK